MRNEKVIPKTEKIQINQRKSLRKEKRLKRKISKVMAQILLILK